MKWASRRGVGRRLMCAKDGDGDHGGGRPVEAGAAGQGEEVSAALRLLIVQNDPESGPGTLEYALMAGGADLEFWLPFREEPAPPLDSFAGVLVFGGATNPDEDEAEPWLSEVREYIGEVVERGVPYLGVCLGGSTARASRRRRGLLRHTPGRDRLEPTRSRRRGRPRPALWRLARG